MGVLRFTRFLVSVLAVPTLLGGCLLPQPDTPPIPPFGQAAGSMAAPSTRKPATPVTQAPENAVTTTDTQPPQAASGGTGAMASTAPLPTAGPGTLTVKLAGEAVDTVTLSPVSPEGKVFSPTLSDNGFTVELPAGDYTLTLKSSSREVKAVQPIHVTEGVIRRLTITVSRDAAQVDEALDLVPAT